MKILDFDKMKDVLMSDVPKYWKKKDFRDFEYIKNPIPVWCYIVSLIACCGICVGGFFIAKNQDF